MTLNKVIRFFVSHAPRRHRALAVAGGGGGNAASRVHPAYVCINYRQREERHTHHGAAPSVAVINARARDQDAQRSASHLRQVRPSFALAVTLTIPQEPTLKRDNRLPSSSGRKRRGRRRKRFARRTRRRLFPCDQRLLVEAKLLRLSRINRGIQAGGSCRISKGATMRRYGAESAT